MNAVTDEPQGGETNSAQTIVFNKRSGIAVGPMLAVALSGGLAIWMWSGSEDHVGPLTNTAPPPQSTDVSAAARSIRSSLSVATVSNRSIQVRGETRPVRTGHITTTVNANIDKVLVSKGDYVASGQALLHVASDTFLARQSEARIRLSQAQEDLTAIEALADKGLTTADKLRAQRTTHAAAIAQWSQLEKEASELTISSPFEGIVDTLNATLGDRVSPGSSVATVIDLSTILVDGAIPQADIRLMSLGQKATVSLSTGEQVEGVVSYISRNAAPATRTFAIEVSVPNADGNLRSGASASIAIQGPEVLSHAVSTAHLSIGDDGSLGVKIVNDGTSKFVPVEILNSSSETVSVIGLPDTVEIITTGQAFLQDGDAVQATREDTIQ